MPTQKLTSVDAFLVIDLEDAPVSTGIVRRAPKVLPSGAADLARTITYAYASLGMQRGGASAGISAPDDQADAATAAFVAEIEPVVAAGTFLPDAGKGVTEAQLATLRAEDARNPLSERAHDRLIAAGAVAAAEHAVGALDGCRVAIEGYDEASRQLVGELIERGARVVAVSTPKGTVHDDGGLSPFELAKGAGIVGEGAGPAFKVLGTDCDVLFSGSKMGAIDHTGAAFVKAKAVVPTGPIPVTAKALAMLRREGTVVLPDFVVLAGPLLAAWDRRELVTDSAATEAAVRETVTAILAEVSGHADGPLLGACERAEAFLRTWRAALPFGRPLAA